MRRNLTGTWHGEFVYGTEYSRLTGVRVPFVMVLRERWLLGTFRGTVRDGEVPGGIPGLAEVDGGRRRRRIEFVKTYPEGYALTQEGVLERMRDSLKRESNLLLPDRPLPSGVHYVGNLDAAGRTIDGTWRCLATSVPTFDLVVPGVGTGTWSAQRVSRGGT